MCSFICAIKLSFARLRIRYDSVKLISPSIAAYWYDHWQQLIFPILFFLCFFCSLNIRSFMYSHRIISLTNAQIFTKHSCSLYPLAENKLPFATFIELSIGLEPKTFRYFQELQLISFISNSQIKFCKTGETLGMDIICKYFQFCHQSKTDIL